MVRLDQASIRSKCRHTRQDLHAVVGGARPVRVKVINHFGDEVMKVFGV
jgi:hypothetical protein